MPRNIGVPILRVDYSVSFESQVVLNKRSTSRLYIVTSLFNFYAEYIMQNAGLYEAQAGIQIPRKNIKNLRYTDNTTLMAKSKEELKIGAI